MWRLVFAGVATYDEISSSWSYDDLNRGSAMLDFKQAVEETFDK